VLILGHPWLLAWHLLRRLVSATVWRGVIAPHLLPHLLPGSGLERRARAPVWLLTSAWTLGFVALAGPTWEREPAPFAEDRAALVVVLQLTPAMLARDVQPSRIERARHKISDLLERRGGGRTALVAYAGSAHRVMPLTRDARIIEQFAGELSPALMPREGDDPVAAIELALDELERAGVPGSVLLVGSSLPVNADPGVGRRVRALGASLHVLGIAAGPEVTAPPGSPPAPALDRAAARAAADALGATWTEVTVDDRDVDAIERALRHQVTAAAGAGGRWRDMGYPLAFPVALLALAWFRRGWLVAPA
jgi:Ca-activated chloride channel family protein